MTTNRKDGTQAPRTERWVGEGGEKKKSSKDFMVWAKRKTENELQKNKQGYQVQRPETGRCIESTGTGYKKRHEKA